MKSENCGTVQMVHHPETGYFKEVWRGERHVTFTQETTHDGKRDVGSSIYSLLINPNFISWHQVRSDEIYNWHAGGTLKICVDMKQLLALLILINCHLIQGVLEWTVAGKVTDYGQNVTLFCHVPNCCPKDAGWDRWTPVQQTLFIDVKTGHNNKKYDGKAEKDGYTLVIQNLTKEDLNVSYSCLYDVTLGPSKFLFEADVFTG
ncbi:unnamed protein product [Mytilus edulis]|uniref:DUF985 domain-containing protein n=1 Tax=Mytilus edulis TaxID=6550 RepID=A0A8S3VPX9_MYTED|nr:unnamed protein product [Mytilus edulis]